MTMTTHEQIKRAGQNDVGDWGEKDQRGAYAKGTKFMVNGKPFDLDSAPPLCAADNAGKRKVPLKGTAGPQGQGSAPLAAPGTI